jgi:hypothetical protein
MSVEDVEGIVIQTSDDLSFLKVIDRNAKQPISNSDPVHTCIVLE